MKRIVSFCMALILVISISSASALEMAIENQKNYYSPEIADLIADAFLTKQELTGNVSAFYPMDSKAVLAEVLFDADDLPSAYKYNIFSKNESYSGYIVICAQRAYAPVIEYVMGGEEFSWETVLKKIEPELLYDKTYYLGGINYIIAGQNQNGDTIYVDPYTMKFFAELPHNNTYTNGEMLLTEDCDFGDAWDVINVALQKNYILQQNVCNTTNPLISLISTSEDYTIPGAENVNYFLMTNFSGYTNHCGPTAATNYFYFMHSVYDFEFSMNWNSIFKTLHTLSGCNDTDGTYNMNLRDAISTFWKTYGYNGVAYLYSASSSAYLSTIRSGNGCIILTQNHPTYGDHFVFSYGYTYKLFNNIKILYVKIADGWSSGVRTIAFASTFHSIIESAPSATMSVGKLVA